jgi:outer membrane protein assembly factor BamE (lipoprotein component of BamABCDE complex)
MSLRAALRLFAPLALILPLSAGLSACTTGLDGFTDTHVEGYDLDSDALAQIRPGQSQELVVTVLGSPQFTNDFGTESAYYYISKRVTETAFGMQMNEKRTVLAIYFDKDKRVKDRAIYTLKDGRTFTIEQRRTPSYGEDKTFIDSILSSFNGSDPTSSVLPTGGS